MSGKLVKNISLTDWKELISYQMMSTFEMQGVVERE